jgi:peptidyl-prolyl cis-trans isomerase C
MMHDSKLMGFGLVLLALGGCQKAVASSQNHPSDRSALLAKVDSRMLTVAGAQSEVDRLPLEERVRFATSATQHEFLQKLVDQEILAAEAEKLGYDRAPEVLAAAKRAMVVKLLKERIGNGPKPGEVSIEAARKYYEEHPREFGPPEKVRVALLMVKDPARARAIRDEAEHAVQQAASRGLEVEQQVFRELVAKYSEEPGARDVTISMGLNSSSYPPAVNAGAAALKNPGDLSPVIEADGAAYILQLEERTAASTLPFERVKDHAMRAVSEALRDRKMQALVTELATRHHAEVHPERFGAVQFQPDPYMQAATTPVAPPPRESAPAAAPR